MSEQEKKSGAVRRDFLKLAGFGAVGAAAAAVGTAGEAQAAAAERHKAAGYRETEHVKTVYKLARF